MLAAAYWAIEYEYEHEYEQSDGSLIHRVLDNNQRWQISHAQQCVTSPSGRAVLKLSALGFGEFT